MKNLFKILVCMSAILSFINSSISSDRFSEIDTNNDGYISWEEFQAAMPKLTRAAFDAINSSKSGAISREEWEKFETSHGGMMGMGGGGGMHDVSKMKMAPGHSSKVHGDMHNGSNTDTAMPVHNHGHSKPLVQPPKKQ